eukprot:120436-Chlamydomonas_euryale.AAC.4
MDAHGLTNTSANPVGRGHCAKNRQPGSSHADRRIKTAPLQLRTWRLGAIGYHCGRGVRALDRLKSLQAPGGRLRRFGSMPCHAPARRVGGTAVENASANRQI